MSELASEFWSVVLLVTSGITVYFGIITLVMIALNAMYESQKKREEESWL